MAATQLAHRLASTNSPAISILGGLKDLIYPWLDKDVAEQFVAAKRLPEFGAVIYAKEKYRGYLTTC
jgi:glucosamine kinase